jgi:hypothetical protein
VYAGVQDYTCLLVKRERLRGQLQPEQTMQMMVRSQPFAVYLNWVEPRDQAGQQVCYAAGKNRGMMRVKAKGILGAAGFLSIDPRDPRAQQASRHSITEAGIGNLIEKLGRAWENERAWGVAQVQVADYDFAGRRCRRVEVVQPETHRGRFPVYRSVAYFDQQTRLPVRTEVYDWPQPGGQRGGELLEVFSFVNLRLNVGLRNDVFDH